MRRSGRRAKEQGGLGRCDQWRALDAAAGERVGVGHGVACRNLGPGAGSRARPQGIGSRLFLRRYKPDQVQRDHGFHHISARRVLFTSARTTQQGTPEQARSIGGLSERMRAARP